MMGFGLCSISLSFRRAKQYLQKIDMYLQKHIFAEVLRG